MQNIIAGVVLIAIGIFMDSSISRFSTSSSTGSASYSSARVPSISWAEAPADQTPVEQAADNAAGTILTVSSVA